MGADTSPGWVRQLQHHPGHARRIYEGGAPGPGQKSRCVPLCVVYSKGQARQGHQQRQPPRVEYIDTDTYQHGRAIQSACTKFHQPKKLILTYHPVHVLNDTFVFFVFDFLFTMFCLSLHFYMKLDLV